MDPVANNEVAIKLGARLQGLSLRKPPSKVEFKNFYCSLILALIIDIY
jgi:hypothetical protein